MHGSRPQLKRIVFNKQLSDSVKKINSEHIKMMKHYRG